MGKSIEHLQCHRIYIQHIWRYGSRFLTPISGWFHLAEFPNFGRPVGAPTLEIHHGKHQKNWTKLDILGVDNNLVPLQEYESQCQDATIWYDILILRVLKTWPISNPMFLMLKPLERKVETLFSYWIADLINLPYCEYSIHAPHGNPGFVQNLFMNRHLLLCIFVMSGRNCQGITL